MPSIQPTKVRVVLRVRPFLPDEIDKDSVVSLLNRGEEVTVHLKDQYTSRNECYKLDSFFGQGESIERIFYQEVNSVIPGIFDGFNATVFAYGATGSGKTYTMQGTENEPGLIPLSMMKILSMSGNKECSVSISYFELYMDRCYDLLEPKAKEVKALDDKEGKVQLLGLSAVPVRSMDEFCEVYSKGVQRRKVAHTGLNDVSSRSHAVLAITVSGDGGGIKGKLNLIDLAGNEDNRRTCNEGIRLQESAKINMSLFALSNVISALNNNETRIPYRDSKLTRILQDSLGGTSRSLMIACLNPASYQEAVHTVSLAAKSRQIVNHVGSASKKETPKVDMEEKLRAWLESKGKKNGSQRFVGIGRTPTSSVNNQRKDESVTSSVKCVQSAKPRKLFEERDLASVFAGESISSSNALMQKLSSSVDVSAASLEKQCCESQKNVECKEDLPIPQPSPLQDRQFVPGECYQEQDETQNDNKPIEEAPKVLPNYSSKSDHEGEQTVSITKSTAWTSGLPFKENIQFITESFGRSPETGDKKKGLQCSLRKVLSPLSSNIDPNKNGQSDSRNCDTILDPKTPKAKDTEVELGVIDTPLEKFNASSTNLKESLVQEYLSFLNVASKEELKQVKGIGEKRAEYILELREETPRPLKSLSDLEKIGLSKKQVHGMFGRAARGIFT